MIPEMVNRRREPMASGLRLIICCFDCNISKVNTCAEMTASLMNSGLAGESVVEEGSVHGFV